LGAGETDPKRIVGLGSAVGACAVLKSACAATLTVCPNVLESVSLQRLCKSCILALSITELSIAIKGLAFSP
jgi:hypothetical protein